MLRSGIKKILLEAVHKLYGDIELPKFSLEAPENSGHGDYAANIALALAKHLKKNPMEIASAVAEELRTKNLELRIEIVPPGFINFYLPAEELFSEFGNILKKKQNYGKKQISGKDSKKINVEFVSANPTGPLTMANGRGGFYGDALANVLSAYGHKVVREYYINDAGNQIRMLGESILAMEGKIPGKEEYYKGDYIKRLKGKTAEQAVAVLFKEIQGSLKKAGIKYDVWFSEDKNLHKKGELKKTQEFLEKKGLTEKHDGAVWLGDAVLVKSDQNPTYFLSDLAYHYDKFIKRKFDIAIDIWGADHHGYAERMKKGVGALGVDQARLHIIIMQLVRLVREGKEVRMSKRAGEFITLDELLAEVGLDAARYFFLERSPDTHMDFDLDLAKERSVKNPVYYVQYAFARCSSIMRKIQISNPKSQINSKSINFKILNTAEELSLIKKLIQLPEVIEDTANDYQVHRLTRYTSEVARTFHNFYEKHRVIADDENLTAARTELVKATQIVLQITLGLLGIKAPEKM